MNIRKRYDFVLAVYPNTRGVSFVVFEGALSPVDWGIKGTRNRGKRSWALPAITELFQRYRPAVLVLQDMSRGGTRRTARIRAINKAIAERADDCGTPVISYSRVEVREAFAPLGTATKDAIAAVIAEHIPAFSHHIPPPRKAWASEHSRMGLFDAAALALTFFQEKSRALGHG